jgi:hypothetical protein
MKGITRRCSGRAVCIGNETHRKTPPAAYFNVMPQSNELFGRKIVMNKRKERTRTVRIVSLHGQDNDSDLRNTAPSERLGMMWQVALDAWAFKGEPLAESGLPRHIVSIQRGKS